MLVIYHNKRALQRAKRMKNRIKTVLASDFFLHLAMGDGSRFVLDLILDSVCGIIASNCIVKR